MQVCRVVRPSLSTLFVYPLLCLSFSLLHSLRLPDRFSPSTLYLSDLSSLFFHLSPRFSTSERIGIMPMATMIRSPEIGDV